MLRVKICDSLRTLGPEDFFRLFGAYYEPALAAREQPQKDFLRLVESYCSHGKIASAKLLAQLRRPAPVYIAETGNEAGYGLFAARAIAAGALIGEYAGILSRDWTPLSRGGKLNPYLLKYPFESPYAIDAQTRGNALRFANHSAKNANLARTYAPDGGLLRVILVAKYPVKKNGQLLLDYGEDYWRESHPLELNS